MPNVVERDFTPKFDLIHRLRDNAGLGKKRTQKVLNWLAKNPDQQYPLAYWLHQKVERSNPQDSAGNAIRNMPKWAWANIKKRMDGNGFKKQNIRSNGPTQEEIEQKADIKEEKTVSKDKLPDFLKNLMNRF